MRIVLSALCLAVLAALGAGIWALLRVEMDVPDTSSPPSANATGSANNWTAVGQTFVPRGNNLNRISVILAAEKSTDEAEITFHVKETPRGEPLRTVKHPISSLPIGDPGAFRAGARTERWYSFEFEPIPDSSGRSLYFSLEGKDVPRENTVNVLMFYHNGYPRGEAYLNEKPAGGHVVFRAHSRGSPADLAGVLLENLVRGRPSLLGSQAPYAGMAALYLLLAFAALRAIGEAPIPDPQCER